MFKKGEGMINEEEQDGMNDNEGEEFRRRINEGEQDGRND